MERIADRRTLFIPWCEDIKTLFSGCTRKKAIEMGKAEMTKMNVILQHSHFGTRSRRCMQMDVIVRTTAGTRKRRMGGEHEVGEAARNSADDGS